MTHCNTCGYWAWVISFKCVKQCRKCASVHLNASSLLNVTYPPLLSAWLFTDIHIARTLLFLLRHFVKPSYFYGLWLLLHRGSSFSFKKSCEVFKCSVLIDSFSFCSFCFCWTINKQIIKLLFDLMFLMVFYNCQMFTDHFGPFYFDSINKIR